MIKRFAIVALAALLGAAGLELGGAVLPIGGVGVISSAQAIVGRPLTPVSVAGVGRRTVRRCAVGIYNC